MMKLVRILTIMVFLAIPVGMFGCGGGGANITQQTTTLGQQLEDLDAAYKKGLMNEKEYKEVRKGLMEKYTE